MKKTIIINILLITIFSCCKAKDYVTISGKIDSNIKELTLSSSKAKIDKKIKVNENGIFKDTLKLKKPTYLALSDGNNMAVVYLKNGNNINANIKGNNFSEIQYTGTGFEESAYMNIKTIMQNKFYNDSLYELSEIDFEYKLNKHSSKIETELQKSNDSIFKEKQQKYIKSFEKRAKSTYDYKSYLLKNLGLGMTAPDFSYPYEDNKEKKVSLQTLKGKYLYIKFWATWCGYCKKETPYFNELSEKYRGQNIQFVSISIDKNNAKEAWKEIVKVEDEEIVKVEDEDEEIVEDEDEEIVEDEDEEIVEDEDEDEDEVNVLELFSNEDKEFNKKYKISEIPRFIIIDTEGNIIDPDAPAPSDEKINTILDKLL